MQEKILCAAIHVDDGIDHEENAQRSAPGTGYVICGYSHEQIRKVLRILKIRHHQNDGFLTNYDRFVSRKTAAEIAFAVGQIKKEQYELASDDLYEE